MVNSEANTNYIIPSKEVILKLYNYVVTYEHEISKDAGKYDFDNEILVQFCQEHSIALAPRASSSSVKEMSESNYIMFVYNDRKAESKDKAHALLRHLRNAIAHARVSKTATNSTVLDITDVNGKDNISMRGKMEQDLLFSLIELLIQSKRS
jgi:hypothetical protein